MNDWMWKSLGEEFGPVDSADLYEMLSSGAISPDDEVRRSGSDQWQPAAAVPELQVYCKLTTASTPPTATISPPEKPALVSKDEAVHNDRKSPSTAAKGTKRPASPRPAVRAEPQHVPSVPATPARTVPITGRDSSTSIPEGTLTAWLVLAGVVLVCVLSIVGVRYWITRPVLIPLVKHKKPVDCVAYSPDGRWIATGGDENSLCIWSANNGTLLRTIQGHQGHIMTVAFSPDSERVITGAQDNTAKVWDVERGVEVFTLAGHDKRVDGAVFSPDGNLIGTGAWDGTVRIWDSNTGKLIRQFPTHKVNRLRFSADGQKIATCSWDWTARTYDVKTGKELKAFEGHRSGVYTVAFSSDGLRLVTASEDGTARVWQVDTGKQILLLEGHAGPVYDAHYGPGDKRIVTCGKDRTIKVWNLDQAMESLTLVKHAAEVRCVASSPDGRSVVSGGAKTTAFLWMRYLPK